MQKVVCNELKLYNNSTTNRTAEELEPKQSDISVSQSEQTEYGRFADRRYVFMQLYVSAKRPHPDQTEGVSTG